MQGKRVSPPVEGRFYINVVERRHHVRDYPENKPES